MRTIRYLTLAETEIDDAVFWYQKSSQDQSLKFLAELQRALHVVLTHPFIGLEITPGVHRYRLKRFPYTLIYRPKRDSIVVIALAHQQREPNYWLDRY